jgi:hypothetical protein
MVDPGTAIAALGPAAIVVKILGPTADYVGEGVREWTERAVENVQRVFEKAEKKLGPEELEREGGVAPRVLKGILEEGPFFDDDLGAEYLGGVLASGRTSTARDDRGAALVGLVARMSTYQLRSHYIFYSQAQQTLAGSGLNLAARNISRSNALFMSWDGYRTALDMSQEEEEDFDAIVLHVLSGLHREGLIDDHFLYGPAEHLRANEEARDFGTGGVIYRVTPLGIELFCAAHGMRGNPLVNFERSPDAFTIDAPIDIQGTFGLVHDLPVYEPPRSGGRRTS